jgi:isoleucyl-tRNA synthetase
VTVLEKPERFVRTTIKLNTPVLGKRLKQELKILQNAVVAGDYTIEPDGTLLSGGVRLHPGEYWHRHDVRDGRAPVAADGIVVVWLDTARDERLLLEGDARDLNREIQDVRKRARLDYSDRIVLSVAGAGVGAVLQEFGPWLMEQSLAVDLVDVMGRPEATGTVMLSAGRADVALRRILPESVES